MDKKSDQNSLEERLKAKEMQLLKEK